MRFLVIEGNIGVGKSTFSKRIAEEYNAKLILEQFADNPFLPKFYADKDRYSFPLELSFLADRYNQIKNELLNLDLFHPFIVADYYFVKSSIFAQNTLKADEYNLFRRIFNIVSDSIPKPDLYVYLHASTRRLLDNIKTRGREYEQNIQADYLKKVEEGYFNYLRNIVDFPILIIDMDGIDFVHNPDHYQLLKENVFKSDYKLGVNRIIM